MSDANTMRETKWTKEYYREYKKKWDKKRNEKKNTNLEHYKIVLLNEQDIPYIWNNDILVLLFNKDKRISNREITDIKMETISNTLVRINEELFKICLIVVDDNGNKFDTYKRKIQNEWKKVSKLYVKSN